MGLAYLLKASGNEQDFRFLTFSILLDFPSRKKHHI